MSRIGSRLRSFPSIKFHFEIVNLTGFMEVFLNARKSVPLGHLIRPRSSGILWQVMPVPSLNYVL